MTPKPSPLTELGTALADGALTPRAVAEVSIARANSNASHNTYLNFDPAALLAQVDSLPPKSLQPDAPLFAVPISLKDLFDLGGTVTSAGTRFYAERTPPAAEDSALAARVKRSGALITGKTHLHPIAYGITGQNPDHGDCLQPRDATLLTGGSSSGAAASVQEGSALVAIGTDTGGSIRVPAALCGLVGFRASHSIRSTGIWDGAVALAPSFDTPGFLLRDPRDAAPVAEALLGIPAGTAPAHPRIGCVPDSFLHDATPDVHAAYAAWKQHLTEKGATLTGFDASFFAEAVDILVPIQASEAAAIHRGHFDEFELSIAQRLHFGASLSPEAVAAARTRLAAFRNRMAALLAQFDFLLIPCAPMTRLLASADHTGTRIAIIRYTAPVSLAGLPAVSLPGELIAAPFGTGVQLAAAQCNDAALLALATTL